MTIRKLVETRKILVCAGPGGVGKTTTSAALAALAARAGRRTLVCTIDPAPRLADALGLGSLSAVPRALSPEARRALDLTGDGELLAARLDTAATFERLVESQVADPEMRRRIFDNAIYRQITTRLTGSQEYAATLALYDFYQEGRYDLIVLDTPPTANALDFLEAPKRMTAAATSPALRWFARPTARPGLLSFQRLRAGGALVLQRLGKFVGSQFLDDLGAFLSDFHTVVDGFLERARAIDALLRQPEVGFLLVMAPEAAATNEALYFHDQLHAGGLRLDTFVANRVLAPPGLTDAAELFDRLTSASRARGLPQDLAAAAAPALASSARYLESVSAAQRVELGRLGDRAPHVPIVEVPLLANDVSTLAALLAVSQHLESALPTT